MLSTTHIQRLIELGRSNTTLLRINQHDPIWSFEDGVIRQGHRNPEMFNVLRRFRELGIQGSDLRVIAESLNNTKVDPPMEQGEVNTILNSIENYYRERQDKSSRSITSYLMQDHDYITVNDYSDSSITFCYEDGIWAVANPLDIKQKVRNVYDLESTPNKCTEVYKDLEIASFCKDIQWSQIQQTHIPCKDYIYDCETRTQIGFRQDHYLRTKLKVNPDFEMQTPQFDQCLATWFGEDGAKKTLLLEYLGYCLTHRAGLKKCLMCLGDPNTGKSFIGTLITDIVGRENVSNTKIHTLHNEFGKASLPGMLVNIDDEPQAKAGKPLDEAAFKEIVGSNPRVEINIKNKQQKSVNLICKLLILANKLPDILDLSGATFDRLMILNFENQIPPEDRDPNLLEKLRPEYPGIIAKMICAFSDLISRKEFTESQSSKESLREYQNENDPVCRFLEQFLVKDDSNLIASSNLHAIYEQAKKRHLVPDVDLPNLSLKALSTHINKIEGYLIDTNHCPRRGTSIRSLKGYRIFDPCGHLQIPNDE